MVVFNNSFILLAQEKRFVCLQQRPRSFLSHEDDLSACDWVYTCCCDQQRSDIVVALGDIKISAERLS